MIENKEQDYEYAVLIGIINQEQSAQQVSDYLDELAFLTLTAGGEVSRSKLKNPCARLSRARAKCKKHDKTHVFWHFSNIHEKYT